MPFPYTFPFTFAPLYVGNKINTRIAFDSNAFDATPTWTDISGDVMKLEITRGRTYEMNRMEAGTATVLLNNTTGAYWPNTAGTYAGKILPVKRINIRVTWHFVVYDVYTGYIESWEPGFMFDPDRIPIMTLTCADALKCLSRYLLNNAGYAQELSGTRVGHILDSLGWPAGDRAIDAGQSIMTASGVLADINAMDNLYNIQDSEWGIIFQSTNGKITYQDRAYRPAHKTSVGTFGDQAGDLGWNAVDIAMDDLYVMNDIRINRVGGTEQVSQDATSITSYGTRTYNKAGLFLTSDTESYIAALYFLSKYKDAIQRVKAITISPMASQANSIFPIILGCDISSYFQLRVTPATILTYYFVEGINHIWDAKTPERWETTWQLSTGTWSTPTLTPITEYLRPDGVNNTVYVMPSGNLNGVTSDQSLSTYMYYYSYGAGGANGRAILTLTDPSYPHGNINDINFVWVVKSTDEVNDRCTLSIGLNATNYNIFTDYQASSANWQYKYVDYNTSIVTNTAWNWAEVANTNMGFFVKANTYPQSNSTNCAEMWAALNYTPVW